MSKAWTSSGNFVKYGAPVFDFALGIYQVIGGVKTMKPMFNHQIISASRAISKETDDLIEVYYWLLDGKVPSESLDEFHTIYSIDLEVKEGNWDYYSGVYFIFSNGQKECNTKGSVGYKSLKTGWVTLNISNGNGLNDCLHFEFFNDNLNVSVVHHQNTGLRDQVTIDTIQVSVDGNYLPSFEIDDPITVAHGRQSGFLSVKPMNRMLKAIKTHTSELTYSGTDAAVYMELKLYDDDTALTQRPEWIPLDNANEDNFEEGKTDIFRGSILRKANKMIRDYIDFYPDTAEVNITLSTDGKGTLAPAWNTDLLKLYFAGKNGKNVVLRCYAGERWINPDEKKNLYTCTKLEENNPAKSIEMFEAHTCDFALSSSSSTLMKLKFCRKREQFRTFEKSSKTLDCCSTNYFPLGSTRNEWNRYDVIARSDKLDGGDVLGQCEGFDLLGTEIYVGKTTSKNRNDSTNNDWFFIQRWKMGVGMQDVLMN